MAYDNTNTGILFREAEKKTAKSPDYTGRINIDGKDYRLAGWIKDGRNGKFMSLAVDQPKDRGSYSDNAQPVNPQYSDVPQQPDLDDEIPF